MKTNNTNCSLQEPLVKDILLLDYLAVHAPAEPAFWFKPIMPERPKDVWENFNKRSWVYDSKIAVLNDKGIPVNRAEEAQLEWDKEYKIQLLKQWPYAWAKTMMEVRSKILRTTNEHSK